MGDAVFMFCELQCVPLFVGVGMCVRERGQEGTNRLIPLSCLF